MSGIVLSGGGVYGVMFLGALDTYRGNIQGDITLYAGTSSGAIIATLLSVGYKCTEIMNEIKHHLPIIQTDSIDFSNLFERFGLFTNDKLMGLIKSMILKKRPNIPTFLELYETLHVDLIITGTNLSRQAATYFQRIDTPNMRITDALEISICIPLVFPFVKYNKDIYVDGMLIDNFPVAYARWFADTHISSKPILHLHGFTIEYLRTVSQTSIFAYIESIARFVIHVLHNKQQQAAQHTDTSILTLKTDLNMSLITNSTSDIDKLYHEGVINLLKTNEGPCSNV